MTDPQPMAASTARPPANPTRDTLESLVIALILAFVFRAYVVEAFVIPTGSMAPTLLGQHFAMACEQCGYRYAIDPGEPTSPGTAREAVCPMCHYPATLTAQRSASAGDRILVAKFAYTFQEPRRWDVVVFKNPEDPSMNYIKRLVGLPEEELQIIEGNIYVKPLGESDWRIARKTENIHAQQAAWQPVYDSQRVPLDGGSATTARIRLPWSNPWEPDQPSQWDFSSRIISLLDPAPARLTFKTVGTRTSPATIYPYNQVASSPYNASPNDPIEDVRLAVVVQPEQPSLTLTLETTARLDSTDPAAPAQRLLASLSPQGLARIDAVAADGSVRTLATAQASPLPTHRASLVELWYVDQQAMLRIDDQTVVEWQYDLPIDLIRQRRPARRDPSIAIHAEGSPATFHRILLDRDLYYASQNHAEAVVRPTRGGLLKDQFGQVGSTLRIESDQFFFMGDNSPRSHDGRSWQRLDPWAYALLFHNDQDGDVLGLVPRELIIGKAIFVYFPAMHRWTDHGRDLVPNFGQMRFIH